MALRKNNPCDFRIFGVPQLTFKVGQSPLSESGFIMLFHIPISAQAPIMEHSFYNLQKFRNRTEFSKNSKAHFNEAPTRKPLVKGERFIRSASTSWEDKKRREDFHRIFITISNLGELWDLQNGK
ncbi:13388_t:CDS:2 [Cetraspora pellucida]|uniref:13388_t:CDS:1 n=1 Tax=Cetraspora pellucida TaxID=1433469 RepID=A0A9N9AGS6_9GLOM|nr:13388_t:CDS:2 [Cetraspora pellucida]